VLACGLDHAEAFSWCGRELGFVLKVKLCSSLERTDFLKGMFVVHEGVYRYLPLPGMIFKLCKMNNDPLIVFSTQVKALHRAFPCVSERKWSLICMARAISLAWKYVPRSYPILGTFLARCDYLAMEETLPLDSSFTKCVVEDAQYKIQYDGAFLGVLDLDSVYDQLSTRYGLEGDVLRELDNLVASVQTFPWSLDHDAFERLLDVDYR